jgi:uncharacterized membrane protein YfcA
LLITDPWFYVVAIPVVILTGISKTGFPGMFAGMSVPVLSLVIPPVQAAAIMLPVLCIIDLWGLSAYRGVWDRRNMKILVTGATFGIAAGGFAFGVLSDDAVKLITGLIAVLFGLNNLFGWARRPRPPTQASWARGLPWSALSGFTSTIAHAGGPPAYVYLIPQRMERALYVGTTVWFFSYVNFAKLVPYGLLGQLAGANLVTALALTPLVPVGVWLGKVLQTRVKNDVIFYRICYWAMLVIGIKLLWDAISHLTAG